MELKDKTMSNSLKTLFAKIIIFFFNKLFAILNRVTKGKYHAKEHYYVMIFFRKLFKNFYVTMEYSNPLQPCGKMKFKINLVDNTSQHYFNSKGRYEIDWLSLIHKLLSYCECFIDIGANLGIYSVTIAQANPSKKVVAVEALKRNYEQLEENVRINTLSNCKYILRAVSNQKGPIKFYINPIHDGGGSLIESEFYRTGNIVLNVKEYLKTHKEFEYYEEVETVAIDDLVTLNSIMKIDVEGAELDVLKSGIKTFKKGLCDVIIVEVLKEKTFYDVVKLMNELNYECYKLGINKSLKGTEEMDWFVFNIICVRRKCDRYQDIVNMIISNGLN
jgi:FkbM family methyltransferase